MAGKEQPRPAEEVRLLTVRQAAAFLGTTASTIYSKIWRREIPFIKLGRAVRLDLRDLEMLIERSRVMPQEFSSIRDNGRRQS